MKLKFIVIKIVVMILCFFISGLFFLSSGIIGDDYKVDEVRTIMIFEELDRFPLIHTEVEEWTFYKYGTVKNISNKTLSLNTKDQVEHFTYENQTGIEIGDDVAVRYRYDEDYEKEVMQIRKILTIADVKDFNTCVIYGGYINHYYPRECIIDDAVFVESDKNIQERCEAYEGVWNSNHTECSKISQHECYSLHGRYDYCQNSCINLSEEHCTVLCCKFEEST